MSLIPLVQISRATSVDVKYWMKDRSFNSLDGLLKEHGGNRKVMIQSDILLHVPEVYSQICGVDKPYIVFTGHQEGTISEKEHSLRRMLYFLGWTTKPSINGLYRLGSRTLSVFSPLIRQISMISEDTLLIKWLIFF